MKKIPVRNVLIMQYFVSGYVTKFVVREILTSCFILISDGAPEPVLPKIVNGQPATTGQFPHQAAVLIGGSSFCGGSLIARDWILCAAHCTQG
jgi:secreted trypsin-like serine protease